MIFQLVALLNDNLSTEPVPFVTIPAAVCHIVGFLVI